MRQVAHALLTRPPLSASASFRKIPLIRSARLACVKHAASVHPEPGSNSLVKSSPWVRINSWLILFPFLLLFGSYTFVFVLNFLKSEAFKPGLFFWNFQGLTYCSIFDFQGSCCCCSLQQQLIYYIISFLLCQQLFSFFIILSF